ncbi:protein prenylyltransferase [Gyrodon lividus]|nr:protein prenylyltransferase [Gyrodon lividus]
MEYQSIECCVSSKTIEILPGDGSLWTHSGESSDEVSFAPFLFLDNNLGIPQKVLSQVYIYAVDVFKSARKPPTRSSEGIQANHDSSVQIVIDSSSVLILANPSHQTALSARKRLLKEELINPQAELYFIASLLSSQHCAKHAELWYHRRWLLGSVYNTYEKQFPTRLPAVAGASRHVLFASEEGLQQELSLLSRACELYPRNYFAWTHRLICMRSLLSDHLTNPSHIFDFSLILDQEIAGIKRWIEHHISDYSAVHYIVTLSRDVLESKNMSLQEIISEGDMLAHSITLVQEYPGHEALWMYARTAPLIADARAREQIEQFVESFVRPLASQHGAWHDVVNQPESLEYARLYLSRRAKIDSSSRIVSKKFLIA